MTPLQTFGVSGERWVHNNAKALGYDSRMVRKFTEPSCDLIINGLPVEVKTANKTRRPRTLSSGKTKWYSRWQWHISPTIAKHNGEFCLVLLAKDHGQHYPFIIPGTAVNDRPHIQITTHPLLYSGWMAQYLNRWEMIPYLASGTYRNDGPLFFDWLQSQKAAA